MYIDESGNTATLQEKGSNMLVLTGCIIHEDTKHAVEQQFRDIKQKYYFNPNVEIKSNFLRYANPDIRNIDSPIKLKDRAKYDELEKDIGDFMKKIKVHLLAVVIDKKAYWSQYPAKNPYDAAYILLLEGYQAFLQEQKANGICIIDPREGTVEKKYIDKELDITHNLLRWESSELWKQCPNVIERVLFSTSDLTVGIQLCDLYCYPIFHVFEYGKRKNDYWRFADITHPKLIELKFFPEATKKNFKFYQ